MQSSQLTRLKILKAVATAPKGIADLQVASGLDLRGTTDILEQMVAEKLLVKKSDGFRVLYGAAGRS